MKRETKTEAQDRADRSAREATVLAHALHCALHSSAKAIEVWRGATDEQERYTAQLYEPRAAHGGIVIVTFDYPGQRPSSSAHYFDEWAGAMRDRIGEHGWLSAAIAAERLTRVRNAELAR